MAALFLDRCDLYYVDPAAADDRLGESTGAALKLYDRDVPCTYVQTREDAVNTEAQALTQISVLMILFPRTVVVSERMVVRNVRDRGGSVLDAGPLLIDKLVPHRTLGKVINHYSAEMKPDFSLKEI